MNTHTPGPWIVNAEKVFGNGYMVATVNMSGHWQNDRDLIAAAPDLLAALKTLCSTAPLKDAVTQARAAIQKAEGGDNGR